MKHSRTIGPGRKTWYKEEKKKTRDSFRVCQCCCSCALSQLECLFSSSQRPAIFLSFHSSPRDMVDDTTSHSSTSKNYDKRRVGGHIHAARIESRKQDTPQLACSVDSTEKAEGDPVDNVRIRQRDEGRGSCDDGDMTILRVHHGPVDMDSKKGVPGQISLSRKRVLEWGDREKNPTRRKKKKENSRLPFLRRMLWRDHRVARTSHNEDGTGNLVHELLRDRFPLYDGLKQPIEVVQRFARAV